MMMVNDKKQDCIAAGLATEEIMKLAQAYAHFLVVAIAECYLTRAAPCTRLREQLQDPESDVWEFLRSNIRLLLRQVPSEWQVAAKLTMQEVATVQVQRSICHMLQTVSADKLIEKRQVVFHPHIATCLSLYTLMIPSLPMIDPNYAEMLFTAHDNLPG